MKTISIFILAGLLALVFIHLDKCRTNPVTTVRTEKIKNYHDTIQEIKTVYLDRLKVVKISTRPDTFIRNFTDTVMGNHDSFIYVTILKGSECCEVGKWKDSIINEDSIHLARSEQFLKDCDKKVKRKENSLKWTRRIYSAVVLGLVGVLMFK